MDGETSASATTYISKPLLVFYEFRIHGYNVSLVSAPRNTCASEIFASTYISICSLAESISHDGVYAFSWGARKHLHSPSRRAFDLRPRRPRLRSCRRYRRHRVRYRPLSRRPPTPLSRTSSALELVPTITATYPLEPQSKAISPTYLRCIQVRCGGSERGDDYDSCS